MRHLIHCLLLSIPLLAYNQPVKRCSTTDYLAYSISQNPAIARSLADARQKIQAYLHNRPVMKASQDDILRIPVVVHVVYRVNDSVNQNIPDARIYSQLQVLNEDYRRLNADAINTRQQFQPVAGDAKIEFVLANRDPDGNPTNGITRTAANRILPFSNFFDEVKSDSTGGKDPWPTDRYLNIWVCDLAGSMLGYSTFPGQNPAKDGIVIDYQNFGRDSWNLPPPYNLGRTVTHEVGHWLGLVHIWGDGHCSVDDGFSDTPDQENETYGCPASKATCNSEDMFENYMDYTDDACMNIFTKQQVDYMRATLQTVRSSILSSDGWSATEPPAYLKHNMIKIYPNPAADGFYIGLPDQIHGTLRFRVNDVFGNTLREEVWQDSGNFAIWINSGDLLPGVYLIEIIASKKIYKSKIIIN